MKGNPSGGAAGPSTERDEAEGGRFAINPALDAAGLRDRFAAKGRVQVADFLATDGAEALLRHLRAREDWLLVLNQDDKLFELNREAQATLSLAQKEQLDAAVHKSGRQGFQYRYETIRVADSAAERQANPSVLTQFADFLSSPAALDFFRKVTGAQETRFADAQATAYSPGHFLTCHDDLVAGKARTAAYVLSLSAGWRLDWGGNLLFESEAGHIEEGFVPQFNTLNLFKVPARHCVSYVTPLAAYRRYSVTGWLRSISPPP